MKLKASNKNIFSQTASNTVNKSNLRQSVKQRIKFEGVCALNLTMF